MKRPEPKVGDKKRSRERIFRIITLGFPIILLLLLEGVLRLVSYGDSLRLFIPNPKEGYGDYMILNPNVGKKYFQKFEYDAPANDIFLRNKPEGTFRIFVMGSSTVVGFPYERNLMFSRILHQRLEDAYPERHIEVVNTAITAINSFTLLDFTGEILKYEPDMILVYAGHNEFYGAFGVGSNESMSKSRALTRIHLWFMDFRFYQLFRNMANSTMRKIRSGGADQVHGTLMKRIVANESILYGSGEYTLAMKRYRQNMGGLLQRFSHRGVPVFFSEVISNVRDIKPLSYLSTGKEDDAWDAYIGARQAYVMGDDANASELFCRAKDLDGIRFRASEELNGIIHELAQEYGSCTVPMLSFFQAVSPRGIIGNTLLTEHVHPNIEGAFIMADAFYWEIVRSGILGEADLELIHPSEYYKLNWGYTALDSLLGHHRITNLMNYWPFVPADARIADYRITYRPVSRQDSIAFTAFREPGQFLDVLRLDLARAYEARGNHEAAYREYEALLRTNPYIAVNYRDAATSLISLGDLPLALKYFKRSLAYEPSFYASYRIGEIYLIKGDYASAAKSFEEAFRSATLDEDRLRTLGKLYQASVYGGQSENARSIAQQLQSYNAGQYLKIPPRSYTYGKYIPYQTRRQVEAARQLTAEGNIPGAIEILEGSLRIYDSHVAHRDLGELLIRMGDVQNARGHLERAYTEFSFDPAFLTTLINFYITLNDFQQAGETLKELKRIDPKNESIEPITQLLSKLR
jgi:tetratricopeptide (TPR) repeat protein